MQIILAKEIKPIFIRVYDDDSKKMMSFTHTMYVTWKPVDAICEFFKFFLKFNSYIE